ncbi:MAG: amylo-alpha-1,6-glucosidase, partial [Bacteroidota bacterium]
VAEDMQAIKQHFYEEGCIQGISEIFDGEDPISEIGKGTAHQAWSVSVLIEVIIKYGISF